MGCEFETIFTEIITIIIIITTTLTTMIDNVVGDKTMGAAITVESNVV